MAFRVLIIGGTGQVGAIFRPGIIAGNVVVGDLSQPNASIESRAAFNKVEIRRS